MLEEAVRALSRDQMQTALRWTIHPSLCTISILQAYCDPGLVNEVVVPLLSMSSSVLLCISTLLDGANHYSSCRTRGLALRVLPARLFATKRVPLCFPLPSPYALVLQAR